jgi:hypothetical protein
VPDLSSTMKLLLKLKHYFILSCKGKGLPFKQHTATAHHAAFLIHYKLGKKTRFLIFLGHKLLIFLLLLFID